MLFWSGSLDFLVEKTDIMKASVYYRAPQVVAIKCIRVSLLDLSSKTQKGFLKIHEKKFFFGFKTAKN